MQFTISEIMKYDAEDMGPLEQMVEKILSMTGHKQYVTQYESLTRSVNPLVVDKMAIIRLGGSLTIYKKSTEENVTLFLEDEKLTGFIVNPNYELRGGRGWNVEGNVMLVLNMLTSAYVWPLEPGVHHPYFTSFEISDDIVEGELSDGTRMDAEIQADETCVIELRNKAGCVSARLHWDVDNGRAECWGFPDYFKEYLKMIPGMSRFAEVLESEE